MRRTSVMVSLGLVLLVGIAPVRSQEPKQPALKRLMMADVQAWKNIRGVVLSNDGQWLAYRLVPNEGDGEVVLRQVQGEKELKFPAGEGRGFGVFPGLGGSSDIAFSHDSKWLAFVIHPSSRESRAAQPSGDGRPAASPRQTPRNKVGLINVGTGEKVEFENIRSFAFSGEAGSWLALHKYPPEGRIPAQATPSTGGGGPSPFGPASPPAPVGADLLLHELATGSELNLGNVSEFVFDKKGQWLALVIDAQGQSGNGVQLRNMTTGALLPLDSAKATYRRLNWTE